MDEEKEKNGGLKGLKLFFFCLLFAGEERYMTPGSLYLYKQGAAREKGREISHYNVRVQM